MLTRFRPFRAVNTITLKFLNFNRIFLSKFIFAWWARGVRLQLIYVVHTEVLTYLIKTFTNLYGACYQEEF